MAYHVWSVLCTKGILDSYTNSVSLIEVAESLKITPIRPMPAGNIAVTTAMALVSLWLRSVPEAPEHFEMRVVVILPDNTEVPADPMVGDLQGHTRLRTFTKVDRLPIRGAGLYWFAIEHRSVPTDVWTRVSRVPLQVEIETPSGPPAAQPAAEEAAQERKTVAAKRPQEGKPVSAVSHGRRPKPRRRVPGPSVRRG